MILVYKFDFVFVQNIKVPLVDLPCEGHYKPEGIHSAYECVLCAGCWQPVVSAPTRKLGQGHHILKRG